MGAYCTGPALHWPCPALALHWTCPALGLPCIGPGRLLHTKNSTSQKYVAIHTFHLPTPTPMTKGFLATVKNSAGTCMGHGKGTLPR